VKGKGEAGSEKRREIVRVHAWWGKKCAAAGKKKTSPVNFLSVEKKGDRIGTRAGEGETVRRYIHEEKRKVLTISRMRMQEKRGELPASISSQEGSKLSCFCGKKGRKRNAR